MKDGSEAEEQIGVVVTDGGHTDCSAVNSKSLTPEKQC